MTLDRKRLLHDVFHEIITNSCNAIRAAQKIGHIDIKTENITRDNTSYICMRLTDNGIGIKPEHLETILTPFVNIPHPHLAEPQGMGMGLSIVDHVIRRNGGFLDIQSTHGQGTTVSVCLPCKS